jgi:hypothetical protein
VKADRKSDVERLCEEVINPLDPEGLIRITGNRDEYHHEAQLLLARVCGQPLTAQYVRDVWLICFATYERIKRGHNAAGRRVVELSIGDMPMRPVFQQIADGANKLFRRPSEGNPQ